MVIENLFVTTQPPETVFHTASTTFSAYGFVPAASGFEVVGGDAPKSMSFLRKAHKGLIRDTSLLGQKMQVRIDYDRGRVAAVAWVWRPTDATVGKASGRPGRRVEFEAAYLFGLVELVQARLEGSAALAATAEARIEHTRRTIRRRRIIVLSIGLTILGLLVALIAFVITASMLRR